MAGNVYNRGSFTISEIKVSETVLNGNLSPFFLGQAIGVDAG
jgi:hypothetical protein